MKISEITLESRFTAATPGDPSGLLTPRQTPGMLWASAKPRIPSKPELLLSSRSCEKLLGLEDLKLDSLSADYLSGAKLPASSSPYSTRYGGHQFGHWADQLGDGRAITLGELSNQTERFELQLKGAGPNAYSRRGDGLAVLRSSLREFLCSEAMHFLGVPTTRALSLTLTGDQVMRDMFYDGHPELEPGAIVCRVAPSFLRFGHFQLLSAHSEKKPFDSLVRFMLSEHFSHHQCAELGEFARRAFEEICTETAKLICHWMRVGFVHGVMNTDNMSVHSLTIDYGPYGWMESYDPNWTPNTTDFENRRYRFGAQPAVAGWNLARLAESFMAHFGASEEWNNSYQAFAHTFHKTIQMTYSNKLGLTETSADLVMNLLSGLENLFAKNEYDFTLFYRELSRESLQKMLSEANPNWGQIISQLEVSMYQVKQQAELKSWLEEYRALILKEKMSPKDRSEKMNQVNSYFILRNFLVVEALDLYEKGDKSRMNELLRALETPYHENDFTKPFYAKRPEWARHRPGSSTLSCSS